MVVLHTKSKRNHVMGFRDDLGSSYKMTTVTPDLSIHRIHEIGCIKIVY